MKGHGMRRRPPHAIHLTGAERKELRRILRDGRTEQRVARRSRILLTSVPEYNHLFAHPTNWRWTRRDLRMGGGMENVGTSAATPWHSLALAFPPGQVCVPVRVLLH